LGIANENCVATRPKFHDFRSFGILAFWNVLEYHNFHFRWIISNHFCKSLENLVRFGLVIPEFYANEVVRPESIIVTNVSSPMFAMGWGC